MGLFGALALSVKAVGGSHGWPKDKQLERDTERLIEENVIWSLFLYLYKYQCFIIDYSVFNSFIPYRFSYIYYI